MRRSACHFRRVNGYLFPAIGKDPAEEITPEFEATKKVGMPIERHTGLPFKGQDEVRCLRYPNLATFHPLRYLRGVAGAFVQTRRLAIRQHAGDRGGGKGRRRYRPHRQRCDG